MLTVTATPTIPPFSMQEKHCSVSDVLRYFGGSTVFAFAGWYWFNNYPVTGVMLTAAGTAITLSHIIEKRCGLAAKTARAFNTAFQNYGSLIQRADQAVTDLKKLEEGEKDRSVEVEVEKLLGEEGKIREDVEKIGEDVTQIMAANATLRSTNGELLNTIQSQSAQIGTLQQQLATITEQYTRLQQEIEAITSLVPTLKAADQQLSDHASQATTSFHTELGNLEDKIRLLQQFAQYVQDLKQQNEQLHQQITQLSQTRETLRADIEALKTLPLIGQGASVEMSELLGKVQENQKGLAKTEQTLQQILTTIGKRSQP